MRRFVLLTVLVMGCLMASAQYKVDKMDGKCYLAGAAIVDGANDDVLFANIVLWAQQVADAPGLSFFDALDYATHHLELQTLVKVNNTFYTGLLKVDVYGGIIKFRVEDIVQQTTVIISPKLTPLEKLQPEKKPAHKATIEDFEKEESKLVKAMLNHAKTNNLPNITHWAEIKSGKVVKGMNETECLLSVGRPRIVVDGEELQWQLNSSTYIFFKKGVVSSVVK